MLLTYLAVFLGSWSIILDTTSWKVHGIESSENARGDPSSMKGALIEKFARAQDKSTLHRTVRTVPENIGGQPRSSESRQKRLLRVEVEIPERDVSDGTELREILHKITEIESTLKTLEAESTHTRKILDQLPKILDTTAVSPIKNTDSHGSAGDSAVDDATLPTDCSDVLRSGKNASGIYKIRPTTPNAKAFQVYCQMDTQGGGWTVFQHRRDGLTNFFQNWNTYKAGFGDLNGEYWLGLEHIYQITNSKHYELLIELKDFANETGFAKYDRFVLGSEAENYPILLLGSYSGTAGDALTYHAGQKFSTWDMPNGAGTCATHYIGAWWFKGCFHCHLNGPYLAGPVLNYPLDAPGLDWEQFRPRKYSMKETRMSLRPRF